MVFRPHACPLARSASVQLTGGQSGARTSRAPAVHNSTRLPPGLAPQEHQVLFLGGSWLWNAARSAAPRYPRLAADITRSTSADATPPSPSGTEHIAGMAAIPSHSRLCSSTVKARVS